MKATTILLALILLSLSVTACAVRDACGQEVCRFGQPFENPYEYPPFKGYPIYQHGFFTQVP